MSRDEESKSRLYSRRKGHGEARRSMKEESNSPITTWQPQQQNSTTAVARPILAISSGIQGMFSLACPFPAQHIIFARLGFPATLTHDKNSTHSHQSHSIISKLLILNLPLEIRQNILLHFHIPILASPRRAGYVVSSPWNSLFTDRDLYCMYHVRNDYRDGKKRIQFTTVLLSEVCTVFAKRWNM